MKGICFKEELFLKIIDGKKTQTRRNIPYEIIENKGVGKIIDKKGERIEVGSIDAITSFLKGKSKYKAGETIFLKEPYRDYSEGLFYKYGRAGMENYQMRNKLFMPENFARYFIKIECVIVQRLLDIESDDAIAEGIDENENGTWKNYLTNIPFHQCKSPKISYITLWEKINGINSSKKNPFVFVYDFSLVSNNR